MDSLTNDSSCPHVSPSGRHTIEVVGESFYKDTISRIVGIPTHRNVVILCTASLVLDDHNQFDANAVAVHINNEKVGHLSRGDALRYRQTMQSDGRAHRKATCDAAISGGPLTGQLQHDFCVELDLGLSGDLEYTHNPEPQYPVPIQLDTSAKISRTGPSEIVICFPFVRGSSIDLCQDGSEVTPWLSSDTDTLHFFAPGASGGAGRIGVIEEQHHPGLIDEIGTMDYISVQLVDNHTFHIRVARTPDPRLSFWTSEIVKVVVIEAHVSDKQLVGLAALPFTARLTSGALLSAGTPIIWNRANDDTAFTQLGMLALQLDSVDVVIAHDVRFTVSALKQVLNIDRNTRPLWRCVTSKWSHNLPSAEAGTILWHRESRGVTEVDSISGPLRTCEQVATFLFKHRGKTTRSKTNLAELLT